VIVFCSIGVLAGSLITFPDAEKSEPYYGQSMIFLIVPCYDTAQTCKHRRSMCSSPYDARQALNPMRIIITKSHLT
jgi:hypothetical protein